MFLSASSTLVKTALLAWLVPCLAFAQNLTDANADTALDNLCRQMVGMPGCSARTACKTPGAIPDAYCSSRSLLADVCSADMPSMGACSSYNRACNGTAACPAPIPAFPTSKAATQSIYSICQEMSMPGCEACTIASAKSTYADCDLLGTYSQLCKAMPEMTQCKDWKTMCAATPSLTFCATDSSIDPPVMQMFFHTGFADYVLLKEWVPRTGPQYFATWMAIFVFGILYEGWNALVATSEAKLLAATTKSNQVASQKGTMPPQRPTWTARFARATARGLAKAVTVTAAYLLMLVAMTFNVGLFIAVVAGLSVGSALFTEWSRAAVKAAALNEANSDELCC